MATGTLIDNRIGPQAQNLRPRTVRYRFTAEDTDPAVFSILGAEGLNAVTVGFLRQAANTPHLTVELFGAFDELVDLDEALTKRHTFPAAIITVNSASPPAEASNVLQPPNDATAIFISAENFIFPYLYLRVTFASVQAGAPAEVIVSMRPGG